VLDGIRSNFWLKVLSLGIAIALWAYLRLTPNPVIAARFVQQFNVPLETTGLPPDEVARITDTQAVVTVDVPREGPPIHPDMVRAVLNLGGRGPGVYNVPVEVIAPKLEIRSLAPASETLSIERIDERYLPVALHYTGNPRRDLVVGTIDILPSYATLRAPTDQLARVSAVQVDVPFPESAETFEEMVKPVPTDVHGAEIGNVAVTPNLVRVRVRFVATKPGA